MLIWSLTLQPYLMSLGLVGPPVSTRQEEKELPPPRPSSTGMSAWPWCRGGLFLLFELSAVGSTPHGGSVTVPGVSPFTSSAPEPVSFFSLYFFCPFILNGSSAVPQVADEQRSCPGAQCLGSLEID